MKKTRIILPILSALCLSGCSGISKIISALTPNVSSNYDVDPVSEITSDQGSGNDYDSEYVEEEEITAPESYDSFTDGTITASGKYYLKGEYDKIVITKKDLTVYLFLDGITINSTTGIALSSEKKSTIVYIVLLNGSTNTVTNDFADENAFEIKGETHISGNGTLTINSKQKNGFKSSKDLYVSGENVTLDVTGAKHAIAAQSVTVDKSTIKVTAESDGIHAECDDEIVEFTKEQGFAYFVNAKVTANTKGDGIQADTFVYANGGEFNITTQGSFVSYSSANKATYGLEDSDFKYVKSGTTYKRVATDEIHSLSSQYYALANSVKGIKVGVIESDTNDDDVDDVTVTTGNYEISLAHLAKLTINSTDDSIHTNYGKVTIDSANLVLDTFDDGVHADYDLKINNASIQINSSYEGLEGADVTVDGADTNIVSISSDDGINAASDLVSSTNIYIKEGYLRIYASGDGIDANTGLYFQGGTTIVEGPGNNNGSVDSDKIYFQGGIVFACSTNGMKESMSATQNTFLYQGSTMSANSVITIADPNNDSLFSYTLKQSCNQIIFSHTSLAIGSKYTIYSGSTSVATITMTSSLTQVGSGGGGGPSGPGR